MLPKYSPTAELRGQRIFAEHTYQYLTWALALFRGGRRQEAINKLYQTMLQNLYLVPFLLGRNPQPLNIWHGSNFEWVEYAVDVPEKLLNLWDGE